MSTDFIKQEAGSFQNLVHPPRFSHDAAMPDGTTSLGSDGCHKGHALSPGK